MKSLTVIALLLAPFIGNAQKVSKQRFSQPATSSYPLKLHVTHSFVRQDGGQAYLHLVGVVNGQTVELATTGATLMNTPLLPPGDYAVRLSGEDDNKDGAVLRQYDLLLANGQREVFTLVGLSE